MTASWPRAPEAGPYIPVVAMARLERPWEALKLPLFVSRQTGDTLISSTDMGLVGEVLFAELDHHIAAIRSARHPVFDADALVSEVAAFAELSMGLVKEVEMRRDGIWGQRLMKSRAAVAETMEGSGRACPARNPGGAAHAPGRLHRRPAWHRISPRRPDPEKRERARLYAHLLVGCLPLLVRRLIRRRAEGCRR